MTLRLLAGHTHVVPAYPTKPRTQAGQRLRESLEEIGVRDPERGLIRDAEEQAYRDGLNEAKRRLSIAGMHDGACPEPRLPCTCGLVAAIDNQAGQ